MATYTSYDEVGIKENVSDVITNLSPRKTPFQSAIGSEKVTQPLFQWQEDSLRAVAVNAKIEGADPTDIAVAPTVMRNNYTQIFTESVKVSDRADVIATYGRKKEFAYQMAKTAAALKRDLEHAYVGIDSEKEAGSSSSPSMMDGYFTQLDDASTIYTGAGTPFNEDDLLAALQHAFEEGADPNRIQVTPTNSVVLAGFAKASGRYRTLTGTGGDAKTLVNVVNLYVSPFGEQKVEINRFLKAGDTLVYEPEQWSKVVLRPWERKNLAKTGDSTRAMLLGEFSLKHKNRKASALIREGADPTP
jgi:hypothetical protein